MLGNTRCVNLRQSVFSRVEISIHRLIDSHLDKTTQAQVTLKKWSCPNFKEKDQIAKSKSRASNTDRIQMTASVLMVFVVIATLRLK